MTKHVLSTIAKADFADVESIGTHTMRKTFGAPR